MNICVGSFYSVVSGFLYKITAGGMDGADLSMNGHLSPEADRTSHAAQGEELPPPIPMKKRHMLVSIHHVTQLARSSITRINCPACIELDPH